jgi:predicted DNA-binding ribbon-helix-helix protein
MTAGKGSGVLKRSVLIAGHATSVSLEEPFWEGLRAIAAARGVSLNTLVAEVDTARDKANLSSALRLLVLDYYRSAAQGAAVGAD